MVAREERTMASDTYEGGGSTVVENETSTSKPSEVPTWMHPTKCMACSLHFNVYSFNREWTATGACPECGGTDCFLEYPAKPSDHLIFEFVPGRFDGIPSVP